MPDLSLSLVPSSNSFLNGVLIDQDTRKPIYAIDTVESLTSITRQTPAASPRRRRQSQNAGSGIPSSRVATIQWPERTTTTVATTPNPNNNNNIHLHPRAPRTAALAPVVHHPKHHDQHAVLVRLEQDGSVTPLPRFLKRRIQALAGKFHKFRIAGYPSTFKWKRSGRRYQLRATGIRPQLADLTSDTLTGALDLRIWGAFLPSHHGQDQPGAVSSVLLDHIVLTALLLVTPLRDWTRFSAQGRSVVSSASWGDNNNDEEEGEDTMSDAGGSDEWEEPTRFRWGGHSALGHDHHAPGRGQPHPSPQSSLDEWDASEDEMRQVATATLAPSSISTPMSMWQQQRRRSIETDSSRTLVYITPTATGASTHSAAAHTQEAVRRALADMDLVERDLSAARTGINIEHVLDGPVDRRRKGLRV